MALIGNIEQFTPGGNFEKYVVRMEQLFLCNDVQDGKKVPLFLTFIGPETFDILCQLLYPKDVTKESYSSLKKTLVDHFKPSAIEIAETFKYFKREQKQNETINDYVVELKMLAATCNFGSYLERALRDKFVLGLKSDMIQAKLLNEKELTFAKAVEIATGLEITRIEQKNIKVEPNIHSAAIPTTSHRRRSLSRDRRMSSPMRGRSPTKDKQSSKFIYNCNKCGGNHQINNCMARVWTCFKCGIRGHSQRVCGLKNKTKEVRYHVKYLEFSNISINRILIKPLMINIGIESKTIEMEVDSDACLSVINKILYNNNFSYIPLIRTSN